MAISTTHDIVPDSPTNVFAALNPLLNSGTLTNGNTDFSTGGSYQYGQGTFYIPSSGKWVFEVYFKTNTTTTNYNSCGVATLLFGTTGAATSSGYYGINDASTFGQTFIENGSRQGSITLPAGTVIQLIIDRDAGELKFSKNGTLQTGTGSTVTLPSSTVALIPVVGEFGISATVNFGQDPTFGGATGLPTAPSGSPFTDAKGIGKFYYDPPTGALALCTANLPDPDIDPAVDDLPEDYFKAVTYAGSIGNDQLVDCGFPADLIWIKGRTASYATAHMVYDTIRERTSALSTNNTDPEYDYGNLAPTISTSTTPINGFKTPPTANNNISASANTYVTWFFRAGGSPSATDDGTGVSGSAKLVDTSGTASSTTCKSFKDAAVTAGASNVICPSKMSINQKAGFSIIKYGGSNATGLLSSSVSSATIPHGLSGCDFCIIKNLDNPNTWVVSHSSIEPNVMSLQDTGVANSTPPVDPTYGQITTLGSNTVTITRGTSRGDNVGENLNSWNYIMYCWHSVAGYSAFGSYTGNGSPDGPFVYTGFKPAWVMIKRTDVGDNWLIQDSTRTPFNWTCNMLAANSPNQENTTEAESTYGRDYLSNGFKIRASHSSHNATNGTYIYAAFAEQPFKYANAR